MAVDVEVDSVAEQAEWQLRLRRAREKAGLSREAAAKRSGVSAKTWSNVETGTASVGGAGRVRYSTTATTVARMARTVGLDPRKMVRAAGLDPHDIRDEMNLESIPGPRGSAPGVRIILVPGAMGTDEVLAEIARVLGSMEQ